MSPNRLHGPIGSNFAFEGADVMKDIECQYNIELSKVVSLEKVYVELVINEADIAIVILGYLLAKLDVIEQIIHANDLSVSPYLG